MAQRERERGTYGGHFSIDLSSIATFTIGVFASHHFQKTHSKSINVDLFVIAQLFVHFRRHEFRSANDSVLFAHFHFSSAHVTDLDFTVSSVDKDVVAFDVTMDDRWCVTMEVGEPFEDLAGPALDDLEIGKR